jgi:hypothetical protein
MTLPLRLAADAVALLHLAFVLFVVFGGLPVWRWPRLVWFHLPAVLWGGWIEFSGWTCPLAPLENLLRRSGARDRRNGWYRSRMIGPGDSALADPRR